MIIRKEKPFDYKKIYELVKSAFSTPIAQDVYEQDYVNDLRKTEKYIPEFALVAVEDETIIGHIMLTKTQIICKDGLLEELLLSPICVELSHRNNGVGSMLVEESFKIAREKGYSAVFLCGDINYYSRFGFKYSSDFGIINDANIPMEYVLACELSSNSLANKSGIIEIV